VTDSQWTLAPYSTFGHASLAQSWQELERRARPSCFQTWAWIGTWLECLPRDVDPQIAVRRAGTNVTGLAVLCAARGWRHRVLPVRSWNLTETGRAACDTLTVEHNAPLLESPAEDFAAEFVEHLLHARAPWDELVLPGIDQSRVAELARWAHERGLHVDEYDRKPWYWVDLDALRARGSGYLDALSSNTRYQIKRSRRAYEKLGPLNATLAGSLGEAREYFLALERWHQLYWDGRGQPGAFSRPFFRRFHERFIDTCFDAGNVELVRVTAGDQEVGYLYNIVTEGMVAAYQSGFAYSDLPHLKPGLVTHAAAIEQSLHAGRRGYDFLAGRSQYKESLSLSSDEMVWLRVQRPKVKLALERQLRRVVRAWRAQAGEGVATR
jgi:CelD/BcsL family acetyltransferase involved in cellulose biosynthesis